MKRLDKERRAQFIRCLVEGNSIPDTVLRMTEVSKNAIHRSQAALGPARGLNLRCAVTPQFMHYASAARIKPLELLLRWKQEFPTTLSNRFILLENEQHKSWIERR